MTNQTPVEYCRHENCGKPVRKCKDWPDYVHIETGEHFCHVDSGQVAEPAGPPQQQMDNKLKLVLIEWVDSFGCSSHWQQISTCSPTPLVCKSVGWLLYDGADCKVVVPHVSDSDHESSPMQGCGDMTIPTRAIVRIQQFPQLPFTELEWTAEEIKNFSEATAKPYAAPSPELIRLMSVKAGTQMEERKPVREGWVVEPSPISESANREPQAGPMKELCSMTQAASLDFAIDRVIENLDVLDAFAVQSLRNKFKESERELQELRAQRTQYFDEAASLRGLVEDICETVSEIGWCSICGCTDCGKNPLVHKPTCLISEAEAAIKEPHNG